MGSAIVIAKRALPQALGVQIGTLFGHIAFLYQTVLYGYPISGGGKCLPPKLTDFRSISIGRFRLPWQEPGENIPKNTFVRPGQVAPRQDGSQKEK